MLLNKNLIAINQDKLGIMGKKVYGGVVDIWSKRLANNSTAFVLYRGRPSGGPVNVTLSLADFGLEQSLGYNFYESFSGKLVGQFN
jgi:alpha-N-acetylgalactosaminidase